MELALIVAIAVNTMLAIGVAAAWSHYFRAETPEKSKHRAGQMREVIEIDPATVPQYQPTWRTIQ
jgi:uncharacterized membrane protein